jgi:hypothetical protein
MPFHAVRHDGRPPHTYIRPAEVTVPSRHYHLQVGTAVLCSGEVERLYFGGEFVRCGNTSPSTKQLDEEWEGNTQNSTMVRHGRVRSVVLPCPLRHGRTSQSLSYHGRVQRIADIILHLKSGLVQLLAHRSKHGPPGPRAPGGHFHGRQGRSSSDARGPVDAPGSLHGNLNLPQSLAVVEAPVARSPLIHAQEAG